jgi:hypothetical protein
MHMMLGTCVPNLRSRDERNILKCSLSLKKVQAYSKFSKNKIWKKMKSPSSLRDGKFHPPKCRGKIQKIGEETLKGLFSKFLILAAHLFGLM